MTADFLREKFLSFFRAKGHKVVESDSLVPKDDPTVLFTPAGMNQFKKEFLGFDSGFKRAATSQRCLRTDDLEKVGKTSVHHTFFEMLGNFSFGDYFKKEAIAWAWEFLTEELKIPKEKLWVSVYQEDDEAYNIWKDIIKIPENKIIRLGDKDNFWPAEAKTKGPNGPCGPCSEIFYDTFDPPKAGLSINPGQSGGVDFGNNERCKNPNCSPACNCGRFAEIWNLVFTQFNRKDDGTLEPLPNKNIDTGMGLERLAAVMQGKQNNFQTDLFEPLVKEIVSKAGRSPKMEFVYAVADHIRAVIFSIYDGIMPSNEGRGYVVRKIIRKAILHLNSFAVKEPFLYRLVAIVVEIMHKPYPELAQHREDIAQIILAEEKSFLGILNTSPLIIENEIQKIPRLPGIDAEKDGYTIFSSVTSGSLGITVFKLYDTNGIPKEVTIAEVKKYIKFDDISLERAYQSELEKQKELSKSGSAMKGDVFAKKGLGLEIPGSKFTGYKENKSEARVLAILKNSKPVNGASGNDAFEIILDQTPFYAESGGQVGDTGKLESGKNTFEVSDTKKIDNFILHIGKVKNGSFKAGDKLTAQIDKERRLKIARNHTATHILQAALREVLGSHVQQQGSLVTDEKLRFDFTHFKGLCEEEIARVEELANANIKKHKSVATKEMPFKEAKKAGALAFFEEKYAEIVRVVEIGDISKELCGGTHTSNIKEIGLIKIISESSVASGIRRIEAVCAEFAEEFIEKKKQKDKEESERKIKLEEFKAAEKKRSAQMGGILKERSEKLAETGQKINQANAIFSVEENLDMGSLRSLADMVKAKINSGIVVLASISEEKASLVISLTADLCVKGLSAKNIVREVAPLIGGSGGGRDDFAQAGGSKGDNFKLVFDKIKDIIIKL